MGGKAAQNEELDGLQTRIASQQAVDSLKRHHYSSTMMPPDPLRDHFTRKWSLIYDCDARQVFALLFWH
jgi:hypothetical protein